VPHTYGLQAAFDGVTHVFVELQVAAGVSVEPVQVAAAHWVPAAYLRQAPLPLQEPSVPHVDGSWRGHWLSGSWPAGTAAQVPSDPASPHDVQVPVQAVEQQMPPGAQKLWMHWLAAVQG